MLLKDFLVNKVGTLQGWYPSYKSKFSKNSYNTSAIYRTYKGKQYCNIELNFNTRRIR